VAGRQGRRRIRIRAHCNKDRTGDSSGGSTTLLNPSARGVVTRAQSGAEKINTHDGDFITGFKELNQFFTFFCIANKP